MRFGWNGSLSAEQRRERDCVTGDYDGGENGELDVYGFRAAHGWPYRRLATNSLYVLLTVKRAEPQCALRFKGCDMSALDAAMTLAVASGWSLTNLEMQKLLYLSQMTHMGENNGEPIFSEDFQAWKLGPVIPELHNRARLFGSSKVTNLFHKTELAHGSKRDTVVTVYNDLKSVGAWKLVAITHWENGAWAKNYRAGASFIPIPKEDILDEYRKRIAA